MTRDELIAELMTLPNVEVKLSYWQPDCNCGGGSQVLRPPEIVTFEKEDFILLIPS